MQRGLKSFSRHVGVGSGAADALGKERGGLGDHEVMRFMVMARQPRNPTDSPSPGPIVLRLALPPPLPLRAPRGFLQGGGWEGDPEALPGAGSVPIRLGGCRTMNLCFGDSPPPSSQRVWSWDEAASRSGPRGLGQALGGSGRSRTR